MKQDIKKIFKKCIKSKILKTILLLLLTLWILKEWYSIYIDMYNFWQLEKAKPILETIKKSENNQWFGLLKNFNFLYKSNISPIYNCYYVSNSNWEQPYIFWFKLESFAYKSIYNTKYYAYPKYDIKRSTWCVWWARVTKKSEFWCRDRNRLYFEKIISNPCEN